MNQPKPPSPASGPAATPPPMAPGDQAPAGTPGTGESLCPSCGGSGKLQGNACPECQGTGKLVTGVGGG